MTALVDWRLAAPSEVVPLVEAEARVWRDELHWDVTDSWHVIEPARCAGQLPGFLARDDSGKAVGWTAYLRHGTSVQVMALVAPTPDATRVMVDRMLESDEARTADVAIVCVRDTNRGITDALTAHGFTVEPYRYLEASLAGLGLGAWDLGADLVTGSPKPEAGGPAQAPSPKPQAVFSPWPDSNDGLARLFSRAYAHESMVRAFAPHGTHDEWVEYLEQLRKGPGCGWFRDDLSLVTSTGESGQLEAAVLVTQLAPSTVHIAQLAVDPAARRRGLARQLVTAALTRAATRYMRATLLVSAGNQAAGALYGSLGFSDLARFVVATRR